MNRVKLLDGYTLTHEHMTIDLSDGDLGTTSFEPLVRDLKMAYDCGVRNIVDMINQSMGRDPEYVRRLMDATGINIILSTGYYLEQYIKGYVEDAAVAELSQLTLSMDICRAEDLKTAGGYGYVYLFKTFLPMLKERGLGQSDIELILADNPVRLFA